MNVERAGKLNIHDRLMYRLVREKNTSVVFHLKVDVWELQFPYPKQQYAICIRISEMVSCTMPSLDGMLYICVYLNNNSPDKRIFI